MEETEAMKVDESVSEHADDFVKAVQSLKSTVDLSRHDEVQIYQKFHDAFTHAFSSEYHDPFNIVQEYVNELNDNMNEWIANPTKFNAPYTSIVNASMMGKSRLIKEMATRVPTIYISLRKYDDGYPLASPEEV